MLSLVIIIIVVLILAAIAFANSASTIEEANYSSYSNNVGEVAFWFKETSVSLHGSEMLLKNPKRDDQIYNYVAKGGTKEEEFLNYDELPPYTIIKYNAQIGMELPEMKVESGTGRVVKITYASTREGKIFTWPPYEHDGKLWITATDTVEDKMQTTIQVGSEVLTIELDPVWGTLREAPGVEHDGILGDEESPSPEVSTPENNSPEAESPKPSETPSTTPSSPEGHEYGAWSTTKQATCNEVGTRKRSCIKCGMVQSETIEKNSENHVGGEKEEVTKVATCSQEGIISYKCASCDLIFRTEQISKNPNNHYGSETSEVTKTATCSDTGTRVVTCSNCNVIVREEIITKNLENHTGTEIGEITKSATCGTTGIKAYKCSDCNTTLRTEIIAKDNSKHYGSEKTEVTKKPTCVETGTKVYKCSECDGLLKTETLAKDTTNHAGPIEEHYIAPTEVTTGRRWTTCNACGTETASEEIGMITAKVIYSADDNSLRFYKNEEKIVAGSQYKNLTATNVYENIETIEFAEATSVPWYDLKETITSVIFVDEIRPKSTAYWFNEFTNASSIINTEKLSTENVVSMGYMFNSFGANTSTIDFGNIGTWNVENVKNMEFMFANSGYVAGSYVMDLSSWNPKSAIIMDNMFFCCGFAATTWSIGDISNWEVENVTSMASMFAGTGYCSSEWNLGNINKWDVRKVTDMTYMFNAAGRNATNFNLDLSDWQLDAVPNISYMFSVAGYNSQTINLNVSTWNTEEMTQMKYTFNYLGYNSNPYSLDLSNWNTRKVTVTQNMFNACRNLEKITIGPDFNVGHRLPEPNSEFIENATGKWYNVETGVGYVPANIPVGTAGTYVAFPINHIDENADNMCDKCGYEMSNEMNNDEPDGN